MTGSLLQRLYIATCKHWNYLPRHVRHYMSTHLSLLRLCDWLFLRVGILVGVLLLTGDSRTGDIGPLLPAVRGVVGLLPPFIVGIRLGDCEPLTRENNIDEECSLQKHTGF